MSAIEAPLALNTSITDINFDYIISDSGHCVAVAYLVSLLHVTCSFNRNYYKLIMHNHMHNLNLLLTL